MLQEISELWNSVPSVLNSFSSDNHALIAFALILISLLCGTLFRNAPTWPRLSAFLLAIGVIVGTALFFVGSNAEDSRTITPLYNSHIVPEGKDGELDFTGNTACALLDSGVVCFPKR